MIDLANRDILRSRVFHKIQNMQCVSVEWRQVVTHYCDQYEEKNKSELLDPFPGNAISFKIALKTAKSTLQNTAKFLNGQKTSTD